MIVRPIGDLLETRLREPRRFIQVLAGPRQVGKTTLARQITERVGLVVHFASADEPALRDRIWIEQQWDIARLRAIEAKESGAVLVLDEVQKLPAWSESVKRLWDRDSADDVNLKLLLLGSAPLLIQRGLTESLTGRFEIIPLPHWFYREMQAAFGFDLDRYVYFGGYPGAAPLIADEERWRRYVNDALIETTLSRDVLLLTRVDKPALLRRLFQLACSYSGQILSYQKMIGQLQDAGNTTTLAHYLDLLAGAGMVAGLTQVRRRAGAPARVQPQVAGAEYRPDERPVGAKLRGGASGSRAMGPAGRVGGRCAPGQQRHGDRHPGGVLERSRRRGRLCAQPRPGRGRAGSENRTQARSATRDGSRSIASSLPSASSSSAATASRSKSFSADRRSTGCANWPWPAPAAG